MEINHMSHTNKDHSVSVPSGALGARIVPEAPKPTPTAGQPASQPPTNPGYTRTSSDYVPSEAPRIDINVSAIRDSVARTMAAHDRSVAASNGTPEWLTDAKRLNDAVRAGECTAEQAQKMFAITHPTVTVEQVNEALGGGQ